MSILIPAAAASHVHLRDRDEGCFTIHEDIDEDLPMMMGVC